MSEIEDISEFNILVNNKLRLVDLPERKSKEQGWMKIVDAQKAKLENIKKEIDDISKL